MDLVAKPPMSWEQMDDFFRLTMNDALRYGLTSIHDAATVPEAVLFFKEYVASVIRTSRPPHDSQQES